MTTSTPSPATNCSPGSRSATSCSSTRPDAEYAAGHIPGAISTPPDRLDVALEGLPADGDVVAYCRGPYCVYAHDAVRELRARGRRALRLEEGLPEWRRSGGVIES